MNPNNTTSAKSCLLINLRRVSGARRLWSRAALGVAALSLLINPLAAQFVQGNPDSRSDPSPAFRPRGTSLATLHSMPLGRPHVPALGAGVKASAAGVEFARSRILVAFQEGTTPQEKQATLARCSGGLRISPDSASPYFDLVQIVGDSLTVEEAIARLRNDPHVRVAEPDYYVHTQDNIPNDEFFKNLWGLQNIGQGSYYTAGCKTCSKPGADIGAVKAWDRTTGSSQVIVGVIDTGVDYTHPDLAANILRDSTGKVVGYDYVNKDDDPMDDYGHGTHCAGTIGAVGNNGIGVAGVCWNVRIMPLKFLDSSGGGYTSDAVSCIDFAIAHGAHILSNSWGGGGFNQLLLDAIRRAEKAGILFVAAGGNSGLNIDPIGFYPASYNQYASNVISVAATDGNDALASFSNYGPKTCDIAAPGSSIYSTVPTGTCPLCYSTGYTYATGTSMATPHVAGAAALVKSLYPTASATELRARLLYSGDHPVEMEGYTRRGRLDVNNALQSDTTPPGVPQNFAVAKASPTGLRLTWTASGDDGQAGTVSAYQVLYNTIPDAASAEIVEPRMTPGPPGTVETTELTGLVPNTVYYVSIRAVDKVGNVSTVVSAAPILTGEASFFDGAESTPSFTNYQSSLAWSVTADDAHTGSHSYASPTGMAKYSYSTMMTSADFRIDGPAWLTYWAKTDMDTYEYLFLIVQDGATGRQETRFVANASSSWAAYRLFLGPYIGRTIKVGFYVSRGGSDATSMSHRAWVDDVAIVNLTKGWEDDAEGTAQFAGFPPWAVTSESSSSSSHSWSDSPNSNYANNLTLPLMQNASVTAPDNLGAISLVFRAKVDLEPSRDYLKIYASPDDGANWDYLGSLTGASDWTTYAYPLPGWRKVRVLFYLVTNEVVTRDGVHLDDIGVWGEALTAARSAPPLQELTGAGIHVSAGGVNSIVTGGASASAQSGYATADVRSGGTPYGTAVLSLTQGNVIVSEAAVASSSPTAASRIFVDYRTGVVLPGAGAGPVDTYTGVALANVGSSAANATFTLRDAAGARIATGHGTLASGVHVAKFIHQLKEVAPDFNLPADFPSTTRFGTLEVGSDVPLSVTALRLTANQRGDLLLTTTPVADLNRTPDTVPVYFPHFVDGGGYATTVMLLNTSNAVETGTIKLFGDNGDPLTVTSDNGTSGSSFQYSIQPGGVCVFQSGGTPANVLAGAVQVTPAAGSLSPVGAGVFSYSSGGIRITESGVPAAVPTTHAHIFIDQSHGHDTGLAIASWGGYAPDITVTAYQLDGATSAGSSAGTVKIPSNGHVARFVGQLVQGLPANFTGVLDISSSSAFAAVTLRSLRNSRGETLLTTCPIADQNRPAPAPVVFPHIADGGGYTTQFILISAGPASGTTVRFFDDRGAPLPIGK